VTVDKFIAKIVRLTFLAHPVYVSVILLTYLLLTFSKIRQFRELSFRVLATWISYRLINNAVVNNNKVVKVSGGVFCKKNPYNVYSETACKMNRPCIHCWPADRPSLLRHLPMCCSKPDSLHPPRFSTATVQSAFHMHSSMRPPSRVWPVRVDQPWPRSASRSTSWGPWLTIAADAAVGSSGRLVTRCRNPEVLRHHQNASDVTAIFPMHIANSNQSIKSINQSVLFFNVAQANTQQLQGPQ